jgi:hypothetical protein
VVIKRTGLTTFYWLATLALATLVLCIAPAGAQSQSTMSQDRDDLTRRQLAGFDQFLDSHPEIAGQIHNNPSLVDNKEFVENHPALQEYLQQHPEVRQDLAQNPNAVMRQEQGFERHEDGNGMGRQDSDVTTRELANMDRFMDTHPEIAEQLRKDPSLLDNKQFVVSHPALKDFLAQHPGVREEARENPNYFMHLDERFTHREEREITNPELANMDRFMDGHPEIAEQLRKNPALLDNKEFVENHPALKGFLAQHPGVRGEVRDNPDYFMRAEQRYDRPEDHWRGDNDVTRGEIASFHGFLEGHSNIANDLSKNPTLATNQEYLENHSALQTYLKSNPQVNEELKENPQMFVKSSASFDQNSNAMTKGTMKLPSSDLKK